MEEFLKFESDAGVFGIALYMKATQVKRTDTEFSVLIGLCRCGLVSRDMAARFLSYRSPERAKSDIEYSVQNATINLVTSAHAAWD